MAIAAASLAASASRGAAYFQRRRDQRRFLSVRRASCGVGRLSMTGRISTLLISSVQNHMPRAVGQVVLNSSGPVPEPASAAAALAATQMPNISTADICRLRKRVATGTWPNSHQPVATPHRLAAASHSVTRGAVPVTRSAAT
ncbi:hypothetical protein [Acidovorax sp.]|uniref:hypothetical protein n=1 Tax=Acidovorax sp. TaxID=1872122 RepID=UPI00391F3431